MEIRVTYLYEQGGSNEPEHIISDAGLIPQVGDFVALGTGAWVVRRRYFALGTYPAVQLVISREL